MVKKINLALKSESEQLNFSVKVNQLGRDVVAMVCQAFNLREPWFFTLRYPSRDGKETIYLRKSAKLSAQPIGKLSGSISCSICIYIYPENTVTGLITQSTNEFFYNNVKQLIKNGSLYTPPETCLLLASMAALNDCGMYNPTIHQGKYVPVENYIPQSVFDQYDITLDSWQSRLALFHQQMSDDYVKNDRQISPPAEYLKYCQDLDMFGVYYTRIINKNGTPLYMGLSPCGIHIYNDDNKIDIVASFPYGEIKSVSQKNKRVKIMIKDSKMEETVFSIWLENCNDGAIITDMIMEYRTMYILNRKEDTEMVKVLRRQSCSEQENLRRQKEILAVKYREVIEMENKMQTMTLRMQDYESRLSEDNESEYCQMRTQINDLTAQLQQIMAEKAQLEEKLLGINIADYERVAMEDEIAAKNTLLDDKTQEISTLLNQIERTNDMLNERPSAPESIQIEREALMATQPPRQSEASREFVLEDLQNKIFQLESKFREDQENKRRVYDDIRKQRDQLQRQLQETMDSQLETEQERERQLTLETELNVKASSLATKYDDYVPQINNLSSKLQLLIEEKAELERLLQDVNRSSTMASDVRCMMEKDLEQKKSEASRIQAQIAELEEELRQARELLLLTEREQERILQQEREKTERMQREADEAARLELEIRQQELFILESERMQREADEAARLELEIRQQEEYMLESQRQQELEKAQLMEELEEITQEIQIMNAPCADRIMSSASSSDQIAENQNGTQIEVIADDDFPQNDYVPDDAVEIAFDVNELRTLPSEESREPAKITIENEMTSFINALETNKIESKQTQNDVIYRMNSKFGRDKYKTLKMIRSNNTKKHVEAFEML